MVLLQQCMYFSHLFHNNSSQKAKPTWFKYPFHPLRVAGCPKETDGTTEERVETARPMQPGGWVWYIWILDTGYNRSTYVIFNRSQIHYAFFFWKKCLSADKSWYWKRACSFKGFCTLQDRCIWFCVSDLHYSCFFCILWKLPHQAISSWEATTASATSEPARSWGRVVVRWLKSNHVAWKSQCVVHDSSFLL